MAAIVEAILPEHEIIHDRHLMPERQQTWSQHRSEVTGTACD
jgi:hypothetical protein